MNTTFLKILCIALPLIFSLSGKAEKPKTDSPDLVLWAWERPEDLRSIDPAQISIAYLAETVFVHADSVTVHRRRQPLMVASGTKVIGVVRLDAPAGAQLQAAQREAIVQELIAVTKHPRVSGLQIDFDATRSQRDFYRALLVDVRKRLGTQYWIGITALSSWCMQDNWIRDLPINEAVPMLFSLGAGREQTLAYLYAGNDFRGPACTQSVGVRLGEPLNFVPHGRLVYVFSDRAWNAALVAQAEDIARRLQ